MLWLSENWGTILVLLIVAAIVAAVLRSVLKDKKEGRSSCGGDCSSCGSKCHAPGEKPLFRTTLELDGMMCGMCESHVNDAIRAAFDVKRVSSSYRKNRTEIISEHILHEPELHAALDPTGYKLLAVHTEPVRK